MTARLPLALDAGRPVQLRGGDTLLASNLQLDTGGGLGWSTDTNIYRDGAGLLSQRVGVAAQEYRVYRTYTDSANGEWASIRWVTVAGTPYLELGPYANGTGTVRTLTVPANVYLGASGTQPIAVDGAAMGLEMLATGQIGSSFAFARFTKDRPARFYFVGSASSTIGTPTAVAVNDRMGDLIWIGDDGTNWNSRSVMVQGFCDGTVTTTKVPGRFVVSTSDVNGTMLERLRVDSKGNVILGSAALATTATDGFLYVASGAGAPTGTPTAYTGRVPLYLDTTNNKLWAYLGGVWRGIVLT